jgi:hypothetical protein
MNKLSTSSLIILASLLLMPTLQATEDNQSLGVLLDRTGNQVTRFLDQLGKVHCNEDVLQEKLSPKGRTEEKLQSTFDYVVVTQVNGSEPQLYEGRETQREAHSKKKVSMLVTNGFATQLLIFHPYYQSSFTFERMENVQADGRAYAQLHFQFIKGRISPAVLLLRGHEYPLPLSGIARIDPDSGAVKHISTELSASMEDLGLKSFRTDVEYSAVGFPHMEKKYWLPTQAVVEVDTARQHWKNSHRFTAYRLFDVNVEEKVDLDKLKSQDQ